MKTSIKIPKKSPQIGAIRGDVNACDLNNDGIPDKKFGKMDKFNRDLLCPTRNKRMRI
jgi:hypothetical protein